MINFLVIGGSGVMGQAAIKAIRKKFGKDATIIANWFGKEEPEYTIEGARTMISSKGDDSVSDKVKNDDIIVKIKNELKEILLIINN